MNSTEKEKICISCEGRIALDAQVCPYCASDQGGAKIQNSFQAPIFQNQSLEDSLTSLFTPPYQGKRPHFGMTEELSQSPPTEQEPMDDEPPLYKDVTEHSHVDPLLGATVEEEESGPQSSFWPTLLLVAGANICILGLMQLFFSKNGILRLEWNANYWFFHCLIGAPLLYFGYKKLKTL